MNFEADRTHEKEKDYYHIGFTGNGDFICLEKAGGKIVYLDHEDELRGIDAAALEGGCKKG